MDVKGNVIIYGNNIEHIENYYEHPDRLKGAENPRKAAKPFDAFISPMLDKKHVVEVLRTLITGKKGRDVAIVILCAMDKGWLIAKPSFNAIVTEFGDIGSESNFNEFIKFDFTEKEKKNIFNLLK